jgi:hypothetical protein
VAIRGIPPSEMPAFQETLHNIFPTVLQVFETTDTHRVTPAGHPIGRFNLLCKTEHFLPLAKALHQRLSNIFSAFLLSPPDSLQNISDPVIVISRFQRQGRLYSHLLHSTFRR